MLNAKSVSDCAGRSEGTKAEADLRTASITVDWGRIFILKRCRV